MNGSDFYKDRSSQMLGKEFIIVVVVVFSALSFTLGYFVGKKGTDRSPENLPQAQEIVPSPQKRETPALPQPQAATTTESVPGAQLEDKGPAQTVEKEAPVFVETKEPGPAKGLQPVKEKPRSQVSPKQRPEEDHQGNAEKKSGVAGESRKTDGPVYTVQIGAFKSSGEAEAFRKKQAKNKLKTYVITATNAKKEKIFKVRTGEFRDRKSAEVLALKLSKTEKLKTFVTLKNE